MKLAIFSPDKGGTIEGALTSRLLRHIPTVDIGEADVILIPISRIPHFEFNPQLEGIRGKTVLLDMIEYGANDWDRQHTHIWGKGLDGFSTFDCMKRGEWERFDRWLKDHPPILTLKRELLQADVSPTLRPLDYTCYLPSPSLESPEAFNSRPLDVFFSWGHSHEGRRRVQGEIWKQSSHKGYEVISSWDQFSVLQRGDAGRVWAAIYCPHYTRVDISQVMQWQGQSKLSLSLPGAGVKCFRSAESPVNSIMVLQEDTLAWAYPWVHGVNCIRVFKESESFDSMRGLVGDEEVPAMIEALQRDDLFSIYAESLRTIDKYRPENYIRDYILPAIQSVL